MLANVCPYIHSWQQRKQILCPFILPRPPDGQKGQNIYSEGHVAHQIKGKEA